MLKSILLYIGFCIPMFLSAQKDRIISAVYDWKEPLKKSGKNLKTAPLFEGSAYEMEWLQMSANRIENSRSFTKLTVPSNEEHLYFIKSGALQFTLHDTVNSISAGSIALLIPGEKIFIQNKNEEPCEYYVLKYRSKKPLDKERGLKAGGSFIINWNDVVFKPHDKGGIRNYFERPTVMAKRLEMHVTTLNAGIKSHEPHTHSAEELVLMMTGNTEMQIGDRFYKGSKGSVYYLGSNVLHAIRNEGNEPCIYFAFQFE